VKPKETELNSVNKLDNLKLFSEGNNFNISNAKVDRFLEENFQEKVSVKVIKCTKCKESSFKDHGELKTHYKTNWHNYNVKQVAKSKETLSLNEYDDLVLLNPEML